MIAAIDFRLSTTGAKADLLLPAAGYYEKRGIKYAVALVALRRGGRPRGAAPRRVEGRVGDHGAARTPAAGAGARARSRGRAGQHLRPLHGGRDATVPTTTRRSSTRSCATRRRRAAWAGKRRAAAARSPCARSAAGTRPAAIGSEVEPGGTLTPSRIHVDEKHAWPTLTGRQQFYLDHPWFFEADEVLPRWKPLPRPGGEHPILLSGGHARWSIHAIWRGHPDLLRLQRGGPSLWMSVEDARARGVEDGALVRVWNDHGEFRVAARVSPAMRSGEAFIYHAWEPYQFPGWRGNMEVVSSPYKPTHFVGDYGHLRYRVFACGPVHVPRGIPVEIERDDDPPPEGRISRAPPGPWIGRRARATLRTVERQRPHAQNDPSKGSHTKGEIVLFESILCSWQSTCNRIREEVALLRERGDRLRVGTRVGPALRRRTRTGVAARAGVRGPREAVDRHQLRRPQARHLGHLTLPHGDLGRLHPRHRHLLRNPDTRGGEVLVPGRRHPLRRVPGRPHIRPGLRDERRGRALPRGSAERDGDAKSDKMRQYWAEIRPIEGLSIRGGRQDIKLGTQAPYAEANWKYLQGPAGLPAAGRHGRLDPRRAVERRRLDRVRHRGLSLLRLRGDAHHGRLRDRDTPTRPRMTSCTAASR